MKKNELQLLRQEMQLLDDANKVLEYSYGKCKDIGIKEKYTLDELDRFEALTSRFARVSDILIQKIFRLIDVVELEQAGSVLDRINRAEKREIIESAIVYRQIRYLRNEIAHEYVSEQIEEIFKEVLKLTPSLLDGVENVKTYVKGMLEKLS